MHDVLFPFDRVMVMDRYPITGLALCSLVDGVAGRPCSEHVTTLNALWEAVLAGSGQRQLLITELMSASEPMSEGLALLRDLQPLLKAGQCRVVVCTDLTDPLLLKVAVNQMPSVVALRKESLGVLRQAIRMAGMSWPDTVLSPATTDGLTLARDLRLTPRELEWLVTQVDGMGLKASARAMNVSYKTVASWRRNIALRIGHQGAGTFTWRLAQMQRGAGGLPERGADAVAPAGES